MQEYIKKILESGHNNTATLIISNNEIEDIIKIVKSLEDSGLLLKGVTETVQNEVKEQKGGFLSMLLGTLGASLLRNLWAGKEIYRAGKGKGIKEQVKELWELVMVVLCPLLCIIKWVFNTASSLN